MCVGFSCSVTSASVISSIIERQRESGVARIGSWVPIGSHGTLAGAQKVARLEGLADFVDLRCRLGGQGNEVLFERDRMYARLDNGPWQRQHIDVGGCELYAGHPLWLYGALSLGWNVDDIVEVGGASDDDSVVWAFWVTIRGGDRVSGRLWVNRGQLITRIAHYRSGDIHVVDVWDHGADEHVDTHT